jgi:dipeptidyl aminopeptidase/acylaminoacyl peptidase
MLPQYDFDQYWTIQQRSGAFSPAFAFSPDGRAVVYLLNTAESTAIHRQPTQPLNQPSEPQVVCRLEEGERVYRLCWHPDGKQLVALVGPTPHANLQLESISLVSGKRQPLTNNPQARHELGAAQVPVSNPFSPDGLSLIYSSNVRDPSRFDAIAHDLQTGEAHTIIAGEASHYPISWAPDGRSILVLRLNQPADHDLLLCDLATGDYRLLTSHQGHARYLPGPWHPGSQGFYLLTDQGRQFLGLASFDLAASRLHWLQTPWWDLEDVAVSADGITLAWQTNEAGYSRLRVGNLETGQLQAYAQVPQGVYQGMRFSPVGHLLGFYLTSANQLADLMLLDTASGATTQLTHSDLGGIPPETFVAPEPVAYPTVDGRGIPAFLYKPHNLAPNERVPVILWIHSVLESQERPGFAALYSALYQYLLNRKIGILAPNIRGSSGYGQQFQRLRSGDWGGGDLQDLTHAVSYLQTLDWVDPERLGVFGAQDAGFLALSCLVRLPQAWAGAVAFRPWLNLMTAARNLPPAWRSRLGDPAPDAARLLEHSPAQHAEQIKAPLLVIQASDDPLAPQSDTDQLVTQLHHLGRTVDYHIYENQGTEFKDPRDLYHSLRRSIEWLERHLRLRS